TRNQKLVAEATKLFTADFDRQPYSVGCDRFIVSPENARDVLARFLAGARRQLLIYDPRVSDDQMLRIINDRIKAGVDVRVISKAEKYRGRRLHIPATIRDGKRAFRGSQSLRRLELEKRREVGLIITDEKTVGQMRETFEEDWAQTETGRRQLKKDRKAEKKDD